MAMDPDDVMARWAAFGELEGRGEFCWKRLRWVK